MALPVDTQSARQAITSPVMAEVDLEHLRGSDGTVESAISLWQSRNPAIQWNEWQSLWYALRKAGYADPECEGKDQSYVGRRVRAAYEQVSESMHGPEYKAIALTAARERGYSLKFYCKFVHAPQQPSSAAAQDAAGPGAVSGPTREASVALTEAAIAASSVGVSAAEEGASLGTRVQKFRLDAGEPSTPPTRKEWNQPPPAAGPEAFLHDTPTYRKFREFDCAATEDTEEFSERVVKMSVAMDAMYQPFPLGSSQLEAAEMFLHHVRQFERDYRQAYSKWRSEQPDPAQAEPIRMWAFHVG